MQPGRDKSLSEGGGWGREAPLQHRGERWGADQEQEGALELCWASVSASQKPHGHS